MQSLIANVNLILISLQSRYKNISFFFSSLFFKAFMILSLLFVSWDFAMMFLDVNLFHLYDFQLGNMVSLLLRGFLVLFP